MEKSILIRILSSIPILGTALALWLENTQMAMAQYGSLLGLLRGLAIGTIIAASLVAASEAVIVGFEIGRFWVTVHFTSHYLYAIGDKASRDAAEELNRPYYERHKNDPARQPDPKPAADPVFTPLVEAVEKQRTASICQLVLPVPSCFWLTLSRFEKLQFVLGAHDAVSGNHGMWTALFRNELSFGDTIEQLDKFYANGAHADIPVIDAMREVRGR